MQPQGIGVVVIVVVCVCRCEPGTPADLSSDPERFDCYSNFFFSLIRTSDVMRRLYRRYVDHNVRSSSKPN